MKKILGIFLLWVVIVLLTTLLKPQFMGAFNVQNLIRWTSLFSILGIGVAFVIITGGIDLSIGSLVALVGCLLPLLLKEHHFSGPSAVATVIALSAVLGLIHGLLITKLNLQPFIVTLCGLMVYRGMARAITEDQSFGFGIEFQGLRQLALGKPFSVPIPFLQWVSEGKWSRWEWDYRLEEYAYDAAGNPIQLDWLEWIAIPTPFLIMVAIAVVAGVFLNYTIWGRYLLAVGMNREAARYSGINTERMTILAYVICSTLAGVGGVLFALDNNSIQPSNHGNLYELYAIAAAVLGGCSLRGGEGSIVGVIIGMAVMRSLYNAINLLGVKSQHEYTIIGIVILGGVIADEVVKRAAARRRAARQARESVG